MAKKFNTLGVMLDLSRNAVMNMESLKNYMTIIRKMGYDTLFLYMEDTYEVDGEPYFGYMRGRYTKDEMKEIDEFGFSIGMEIIPCIQTLAHLHTLKKWNTVPYDCEDILLCEDERTYELIHNMFKTLKACFRSNKIHIGMDEAWMLGRGKYLNKNGYKKSHEIIKTHLEKIVEMSKEFDYELLLWSDMFIRSWNNNEYYIHEDGVKVPEEVLESVPDCVSPVYWDYYSDDYDSYVKMINLHKQFTKNTWFAGGIWRWSGFIPHNTFSFKTMAPALKACSDNKIKNVFMTLWGDDGSECSFYSVLPGLMFVAEYAKGNYDMDKIKAKFKRIVGVDFDDFMKIDSPNEIADYNEDYVTNPSKYMLYSDFFNGHMDCTIWEGVGEKFKKRAAELYAVAKKTRKYSYIFTSAAKLCEALEIKAELGVKTRELYKKGDKAALLALAKGEYTEVEKRIRAFHLAFEKQWFTDNKPCGFDIQDARLGTLMTRASSCKRRLIAYAEGKIDSIPELEEEILPYRKKGVLYYSNQYLSLFSANVPSHGYIAH